MKGKFRARRVLVPVVLSRGGDATVRTAADLVRSTGGRLLLFHVFDSRALEDVYNLHGLSEEEALARMRGNADVGVRRLLARPWLKGIPAETRFGSGIPAAEIVREAGRWRADLVVLERRVRSGLSHLLYGHTAEDVVQRAPCAVLVLPG